ncbi:solute carrier organic anion transporter family member 74D-like [Ischnura elegans]|uniref:solute carrier organic anion transporter family member 74D-like n=1 Tax=Ischnura elegans TaxID=197161 RepID=UPI001ED8B386|nr:solute carrier organic anion transporter family member 74D-like [Ischnura elegans]XP_046383251.1 solute carrier organic anion transporter family member 74D-like [Ischnura elegans]XP_046383252.1 solute carrier organic anion transporter family member 74D-like [Ischnura elegans]
MALGKPRADKPMVNKGWNKVSANGDSNLKLKKSREREPKEKDTQCGLGPIRGAFLQKFANKKVYVFLYGIIGSIFSATYAYSNGTITTVEKRFKIPSRMTGIISVGNDISQLLTCLFLTYYAGKGHRPRWIAFGIFAVVVYCLLTALPHFIYGPGDDALGLTLEHGHSKGSNVTFGPTSDLPWWSRKQRVLCDTNSDKKGGMECHEGEDSGTGVAPAALLFAAQLISGIGGSIYYPLGIAYMDDNVKKSKTPALISLSYFLRMLGPASGYALASFCLKMYISPTLTPTITTTNPRWLGAWWLGWVILAIPMSIFASFMALFPRTLPRAAMRKQEAQKRLLIIASNEKEAKEKNLDGEEGKEVEDVEEEVKEDQPPASLKDMIVTLTRLLKNKIFMMNNLAAIFYFFGYMPYWIFMPKYIETQYRQSASTSSLITGTVGLVFSAIGVLASGVIISKLRPSARALAFWNVFCGAVSMLGIVSYAFLGCPAADSTVLPSGELRTEYPCNTACGCDYVKYSPVCSIADGTTTFISACHAGCTQEISMPQGTTKKVYGGCTCIAPMNGTIPAVLKDIVSQLNISSINHTSTSTNQVDGGIAISGSCPVDCATKFYAFLAVVCLLKFVGATGRASNFLVSIRCVEEKDKTFSMGFGLALMSLFSFIPSPILFGIILDSTCLVWGRTCTGTGNCWLYNGASLRYLLNFTAAAFVTIGTAFDGGVWYYAKNLKIFDDHEDTKKEMEDAELAVEMDEVARATGGEA